MVLKVDLVVVTFFPDRDRLRKGLVSLSGQVRNLILVSNNTEDFSDLGLPIIHVDLNENKGIGYAQNIGIQKALKLGAQFVLTSDQDTIYPSGYVSSLHEIFLKLDEDNSKIGAIGPVFRDENFERKLHPMVKFGNITLTKFFGKSKWHAVSHMISSGMLIPVKTFEFVGLMKEEFFMDWIDTEWCWRASRLGYKVIQVPAVTVSHTLGYSTRSYFIFSATNHTYPREYFKIRNAIFLLKDSIHSELPKRVYLFTFLLKSLLVNFVKGFSDKNYFRVVYFSISDGFLGKSGPCPF